jgi:adenylosuccinate lyase
MISDNLVCPLDFRYGRGTVKQIFGEQSKLQYLLDVEAALARAHAIVGNIPQKAADEITKKATIQYVKIDRVKTIEQETRHDIMAVTKALDEVCTGNAGKYIHLGATSYDIVDTANALQFADGLKYLRSELKELRTALLTLAKTHKKTVMPGRTHGQFSIPTTFGLKMAVYALEVERHLERLFESSTRILVGKMSGAVGTGAALGDKALEIQQRVMQELKLGVEEGATQIVGRDRYVELLSLLGNIAASMEKFATEIRNLQRSEIGEAAEAFETKKQVGSSTMPHKQNPILSEQVSGLARVVRCMVIPSYENAIQWHERDLCNSSAERFIIPHAIVLTDWIVHQMNRVFTHLKVYPKKMQENLRNSRGLPMAEAIMTQLVGKGIGRGEAHELMRTSAMEALAHDTDLKSILIKNKKVTNLLTFQEIDASLNPENYIGVAPDIVDRIIQKLDH